MNWVNKFIMGIKGLWNVLNPYSEKKSLYEIRGETLAVDLSGWVCDSQNVADYYVQPKLYLRNLFFRTIYLLLADVTPIFVLEGDAPELKRDVMAARNAIQFKGAAIRAECNTNKRPDIGRKRFRNVLKECECLLKYMGVKCIKGRGEAEATCAELNAQGVCIQIVDAVVSQDSDCFAYGAHRVYRNFSVSNAAGGGAMQGSIDCYDAKKVFEMIGFGRNKMVALAMLCGCDYGAGACGSSINTVVTFLNTMQDNDVIPRLISWVSEPERYDELARWSSAPGRCDRCGHVGRTHTKNGCAVCATHRGCNDVGHKLKVAEVKRELSLRSRALSCGSPFPEPKIMKEFIQTTPEKIDLDSLKTPPPSLIQFIKLMSTKLNWTEKYCVVKFLPLLTKWHLQDHVPCRTIQPVAIKKKRNPRGVPSYVVLWSDIDGQYEALIPDDQFEEDEDPSSVWTTTERQDLMRTYYSELVDAYEESIKKPPKEKKTRAKKKTEDDPNKPKRKYTKRVKKLIDAEMENLSGSLRNLDLSERLPGHDTSKANVSVSVNKLKRKLKSNVKKGKQKTIDSFIAKKRRKSSKKSINSIRYSFKTSFVHDAFDDLMCLEQNLDKFDSDKENKNVLSVIGTEEDDDHDVNINYRNYTGEKMNSLAYNRENIAVGNKEIIKHNKKESLLFLSLLNDSDGGENNSDLSDIIDNIISRPPDIKTVKLKNELMTLVYNKSTPRKSVLNKNVLKQIQNHCSTPIQSPVRKSFKFNQSMNTSSNAKVNTSYFFDKFTEDRDAFEISLDYKHKSAVIVDCDSTVDYSLPDVYL